jgi:hypothetical protein
MLYREIIAVCSQIHTKHINILCGQNVELMNVKNRRYIKQPLDIKRLTILVLQDQGQVFGCPSISLTC